VKVSQPGLQLKLKKWLVTFAALLFIGLVDWQGWIRPVRAAVQPLATPVYVRLTQAAKLLELPSSLFRKQLDMSKRLAQLEFEQANALATISALQREAQETVALREVLKDSRLDEQELLTATRISYAHPEIAAGSKQGVQEGMLVLVARTIVGRVRIVEPNHSVIRLLSDPREKSILAVTDGGVQGLIHGDGESVFLGLLPQDSEIQLGEKVTTLGQAGVPAGLFLGTVARIDGDQAEPTKQVLLEQYVSFFSAPIVSVR